MKPNNRPKTILVVEDDTDLRAAIILKLQNNQYRVLEAGSFEEGIAHLNSDVSIDVIWLDHYLSGARTGTDFMLELRNRGLHKKIPVFVISNSASDPRVLEYISLGVAEHLVKANYTLGEIIGHIEKALGARS